MNAPAALAVEHQFQRLCRRKDLWPGFEPLRVPAAIFDEAAGRTFLFRHPAPPAGFQPLPDEPQTRVFEGRYESVTANTSMTLGGVGCAVMLLPKGSPATPARGAVLVHEAFHAFQRERYPSWSANEADLFTYPFEDPALLALRVRETRALRRALGGATRYVTEALALRRARYARLDAASIAYERLTELNEGLAQYVEGRTGAGRKPALPEGDFPANAVRRRAYESGQALALVLDRIDPVWQAALAGGEAPSLDELLALRLKQKNIPLPALAPDSGAERQARILLTRWTDEQKRVRAEFEYRDGWRVELTCAAPLFPQGFDPLNVVRLGADVLHTRFLKLGDAASMLETLDVFALTTAAGEHPLYSGVKKVVVAGLSARPKVEAGERGLILLTAPGLSARLAAPEVQSAGSARTLKLFLSAAR
jgi:hypothetical protein